MFDSRPTIAEINLQSLRANYRLIRESVPKECGMLAVVKADAYGHGFMDISAELEKLGVTAFGVAFLAEGIQLRKSGIDRPVLVLGGIYPGQERKCIGFNLSAAVFSLEQVEAMDAAARKLFRKALVHLKIDTGMGRLGIRYDMVGEFFRELKRFRHVELEGIFSHFAAADEFDCSNESYTSQQEEHFAAATATALDHGFTPRYRHIANSAASMSRGPKGLNLIRPGISLYGALPSAHFEGKLDLKPVMSLRSRISMLKLVEPGTSVSYARRYVADRPTLIASVPVGYADGYLRAFTNKGEALVRGKRARVTGTVCMDWIMLDVTGIDGVRVGDEVTLLGCDREGGCVRVEELASLAGTIPYEIFCMVSKRVPRVYVG